MKRAILAVLFTPLLIATMLTGAVVLGALIVIARKKSRRIRSGSG